LPVLLANLSSLGQVAVTYHDSLQQLLVLLPPYVAETQGGGLPKNNPTGITQGDFSLTISDPPACTVGFLPPSSWRPPADTSETDTPDGLYCKLPQDSPISVRGARNYPCMGHPGKRAPTVEICDSDQPFVPLTQRQHALGPYPIDPNLVSQGIPPDSRVNPDTNIYGPIDGTAPTTEAPTADAPPPMPADNQPAPTVVPAPDDPPAAPSSYGTDGSKPGPSVAVAPYDPRTGQYVTPDGHVYRQSDLVVPVAAKTWKDLVFNA
jgi:phospholipid/cholesterol/gamma-HCH transport system substrate-binding protein